MLFQLAMTGTPQKQCLQVKATTLKVKCYHDHSSNKQCPDCRLREMVLRWLPVSSNTALEGQNPGQGESPIKTVLRSKGFMWMSHNHTTAFYWSHAGQHFEIRDEGDW